MMKPFLTALLIGSLLLPTASCGKFTVATGVSPVADIANAGGKIEESAHAIFTTAQTLNSVTKADGSPVVSTRVLDQVALAVHTIGHIGLDLDNALVAYTAAKTAGKDLTAQKVAIQKVLTTIGGALADIGRALPPGTISSVDRLVTTILDVILQVKGVAGL